MDQPIKLNNISDETVGMKWIFSIIIALSIFSVSLYLIKYYGLDESRKFSLIYTPLITGGFAAFVAFQQYRLSKRQHELTKQQIKILELQSTTANENKAITHNKLKLDLFNKRCECLNKINEFYVFICEPRKKNEINEEKYNNIRKDCYNGLFQIRFLFPEEFFEDCRKICELIDKICSILLEEPEDLNVDYSEISSLKLEIEKLIKKSKKEIYPYMNISDI